MAQTKITVEYAREKLGEKGKRMTDKEIQDLLKMLRLLSSRAIEQVVERPLSAN